MSRPKIIPSDFGKQAFKSIYDSGSLPIGVFVGVLVGSLMDDILVQAYMFVTLAYALFILAMIRPLFLKPSLRKYGLWSWEGVRQYFGLMCGAMFVVTGEFFRISPTIGTWTFALVFAAWWSCNLLVRKSKNQILQPELIKEEMPQEKLIRFLIKKIRTRQVRTS